MKTDSTELLKYRNSDFFFLIQLFAVYKRRVKYYVGSLKTKNFK